MSHVKQFPGQRHGEKVNLIIQKHWIIYLRIARQLLIFAFTPMLGMLFLTSDTDVEIKAYVYLFAFIYLSYFSLVVFIRWLDEMLDVLIVTDQRLISVDQVNVFNTATSETNLPMIQDVKGKKKGIFGGLLHYGELEIQTAADKIGFRIQDIAKPFENAKRIMELRDRIVEHIDPSTSANQ